MVSPPGLSRYDYAAAASIGGLLLVAYVLVPTPTVQYTAWLAVFCVWMAWFVSYGAKWLYRAN
ncbi:hypothetical protein ACFQJ5_06420 [Halomicroarcula sp. GCM10025324]|jgi:hypothetical protein|uniref:hypothetical protein n=1 Tax=Haloarcula TaxID=2237 RepID=UPI0023E84BBE|nr:hypothetical protein [Halomicroarcula sp. ZS-22-S1]